MSGKDRIVYSGTGTVTVETEMGKDGVLAVYFRMSRSVVVKTLEAGVDDVFVDFDADGHVVGIEMINPSKVLLKTVFKKIAQRYNLDRDRILPDAQLEKVQELISA